MITEDRTVQNDPKEYQIGVKSISSGRKIFTVKRY